MESEFFRMESKFFRMESEFFRMESEFFRMESEFRKSKIRKNSLSILHQNVFSFEKRKAFKIAEKKKDNFISSRGGGKNESVSPHG
jgi:hypothetical protein